MTPPPRLALPSFRAALLVVLLLALAFPLAYAQVLPCPQCVWRGAATATTSSGVTLDLDVTLVPDVVTTTRVTYRPLLVVRAGAFPTRPGCSVRATRPYRATPDATVTLGTRGAVSGTVPVEGGWVLRCAGANLPVTDLALILTGGTLTENGTRLGGAFGGGGVLRGSRWDLRLVRETPATVADLRSRLATAARPALPCPDCTWTGTTRGTIVRGGLPYEADFTLRPTRTEGSRVTYAAEGTVRPAASVGVSGNCRVRARRASFAFNVPDAVIVDVEGGTYTALTATVRLPVVGSCGGTPLPSGATELALLAQASFADVSENGRLIEGRATIGTAAVQWSLVRQDAEVVTVVTPASTPTSGRVSGALGSSTVGAGAVGFGAVWSGTTTATSFRGATVTAALTLTPTDASDRAVRFRASGAVTPAALPAESDAACRSTYDEPFRLDDDQRVDIDAPRGTYHGLLTASARGRTVCGARVTTWTDDVLLLYAASPGGLPLTTSDTLSGRAQDRTLRGAAVSTWQFSRRPDPARAASAPGVRTLGVKGTTPATRTPYTATVTLTPVTTATGRTRYAARGTLRLGPTPASGNCAATPPRELPIDVPDAGVLDPGAPGGVDTFRLNLSVPVPIVRTCARQPRLTPDEARLAGETRLTGGAGSGSEPGVVWNVR